MQQREILYEGKTKQLFQTEDPELILIHYMDTATAFNNIKLATIENKGILNNKISSLVSNTWRKRGVGPIM